eukprot:4663423-Amphidinium_carterae.1
MAEVRSRLRSGSWLSSLEDDRRRIITQWIEHIGLGRQLATNASSLDRVLEIERSVLVSVAPKATATVKKRLVLLNQHANHLGQRPLLPVTEQVVFTYLADGGKGEGNWQPDSQVRRRQAIDCGRREGFGVCHGAYSRSDCIMPGCFTFMILARARYDDVAMCFKVELDMAPTGESGFGNLRTYDQTCEVGCGIWQAR